MGLGAQRFACVQMANENTSMLSVFPAAAYANSCGPPLMAETAVHSFGQDIALGIEHNHSCQWRSSVPLQNRCIAHKARILEAYRLCSLSRGLTTVRKNGQIRHRRPVQIESPQAAALRRFECWRQGGLDQKTAGHHGTQARISETQLISRAEICCGIPTKHA